MKEIKTTDELMNMYNYLTEKAKDIDPTNCTEGDIGTVTSDIFEKLNLNDYERIAFGMGMAFGVSVGTQTPGWLKAVVKDKPRKK